jgi:hypothetical protein
MVSSRGLAVSALACALLGGVLPAVQAVQVEAA